MGIDQENMRMIFLAQNLDFLPVEFWPTWFKKSSLWKRQILVGAYRSKCIINLLRVVHWLHTYGITDAVAGHVSFAQIAC